MMSLILVALFFSGALSAPSHETAGAEYFAATGLRDSVAGAAEAPDRTAAMLLGTRGDYRYMIIRRDRTGEVEVHALWDDIIIVQEGAGTIVYGGHHEGGREIGAERPGGGPGEVRGGGITGGTARPLAAGDLMIVPAGIPHQVRVDPGGSVTYLVVKVASATEPAVHDR